MRKIIITAIVLVMATQFTFAGEYSILNQGRMNACTQFATYTCIDMMSELSNLIPEKAYKVLNADNYNSMEETLQYYKDCGEIDNFQQITASAIYIDQYLKNEIPVIVVTWVNEKDWQDGDIKVEDMNFYGTHATVLESKQDGYYVGINSWGENWGYNGKYHLYDLSIIGSAFIIVPNENVVF